jgi:hypothetical protein
MGPEERRLLPLTNLNRCNNGLPHGAGKILVAEVPEVDGKVESWAKEKEVAPTDVWPPFGEPPIARD